MTLGTEAKKMLLAHAPEAVFFKLFGNTGRPEASPLNDRRLDPPRVYIDDFTGSMMRTITGMRRGSVVDVAMKYIRWMEALVIDIQSVCKIDRNADDFWTRTLACFVFCGDCSSPYAKRHTHAQRARESAARKESKTHADAIDQEMTCQTPTATDTDRSSDDDPNKVVLDLLQYMPFARRLLLMNRVADCITEWMRHWGPTTVFKDTVIVFDFPDYAGPGMHVCKMLGWTRVCTFEEKRLGLSPSEKQWEADVRMLKWIKFFGQPTVRGIHVNSCVCSADGDMLSILLLYAENNMVSRSDDSVTSRQWTSTVVWQTILEWSSSELPYKNVYYKADVADVQTDKRLLVVDMCRMVAQLAYSRYTPQAVAIACALVGPNDFMHKEFMWKTRAVKRTEKQSKTLNGPVTPDMQVFRDVLKYFRDDLMMFQFDDRARDPSGFSLAVQTAHLPPNNRATPYNFIRLRPDVFWNWVSRLRPSDRIPQTRQFYVHIHICGLLSYWGCMDATERARWPRFYTAEPAWIPRNIPVVPAENVDDTRVCVASGCATDEDVAMM